MSCHPTAALTPVLAGLAGTSVESKLICFRILSMCRRYVDTGHQIGLFCCDQGPLGLPLPRAWLFSLVSTSAALLTHLAIGFFYAAIARWGALKP